MAYAKLYFLLSARFCGHRAFTVCLSTFVDTALLLPVHFCGHPAFYFLSTFVDTALLPSVHFCGHRAIYCLSDFADVFHSRQRKIPVYWNLQWRSFARE